MEEVRSKVSELFDIPLQRLHTLSDHVVMTSIPSSGVKKIESSDLKGWDISSFFEENVEKTNSSIDRSCVQVNILAFRCFKVHCNDTDISLCFEKVYKNSFSHTLSTISLGNSDALYKSAIRNNSQCHCTVQDNGFSRPVSDMESCRELILKMHGIELKEPRKNSGNEFSKINITTNEWPPHTNLKTVFCGYYKDDMIYLFVTKPAYTVHDVIMYSPAVLTSGNIRTLFVLYQVLQFLKYFQDNFRLDLSSLQWNNVELNSRLWIKINLPEDAYLMTMTDDQTRKSDDDAERKQDEEPDFDRLTILLDKWVCGELSNFDYLMFLNKLAGRTKLDPNHHPVLPWVSSLESETEQLRDLTKSKYRLNKGDHQLDIQYSMMRESADVKDTKSKFQAPNLPQVPHHVPEFLSDITYYVYMARRTSKDILCKLVRSYWEPNEYPASIQRMQAWTPDECIPEFYTDADVFKSMHDDMTDLAVPKWCTDAEDFVKKHRAMLESDSVSKDLHHWIDVTFGYKLSGKEAIEEKNVCLPLVDNHTKQTNRGITQLFRVPHPQKRCKKLSPDIPLNLEKDDDGLELLRELDELEKLLTFKSKIWNKTEYSQSLSKSLENSRCNILTKDQKQTIMSERNIIMFLCLMIELYLPSQTWTKSEDLPLHKRFEMCLQCYKLQKALLPSGIKCAVEYFIANLRYSEEETIEHILKTSNPSENKNFVSIFQTISDRGLPSPTPALLLSRYVHILPFPPYFDDLYSIIDLILLNTNHYTLPLSGSSLSVLSQDLREFFETLHNSEECVEILTPHIQQLLRQPSLLANVQFLMQNFDVIAKAMGMKATQEYLFPLILSIYESSTDLNEQTLYGTASKLQSSDDENATSNEKVVSWNGEEVEIKAESSKEDDEKPENVPAILSELYNETFLIQLSSRLGLLPFMENIPRCLANALLMSSKASETENIISDSSERVICWLMQRVGPTLTSKYIVRHLFRVLTQCFIIENDIPLSTKGERHANILTCLIHAASLFGPSVITLQYFPQLIHNVSSAVAHPKYAPRHQAAVEASVAATTHFLLYLSDTILVEQLSRLSKEVIIPICHLLARTDVCFYGGADSRKSLCMKIVHLIKLIVIRIGREMARENLTTLFQEFFSHFSWKQIQNPAKRQYHDESFDSIDLDTVIIDHDADTKTFKVGNTILRENSTGVQRQLHRSWFNASPTPSPNKGTQVTKSSIDDDGASIKEIEATFCPETAYCSYVSITRIVGNIHMENILGKHHEHVATLCSKYEAVIKDDDKMQLSSLLSSSPIRGYHAKSTVVGNKIIVAAPVVDDPSTTATDKIIRGGMLTGDLSDENTKRNLDVFPASQLTENWLAYWEHEIGLPENDKHIHFNQIELQAFSHSSTVRCLCCHQSEEWFISGGKDKMVKIWSLYDNSEKKKENQTMSSNPSFVYKSHRKNVNYVGIAETDQFVLSNDGNLHVWDPYSGQQVMAFDNSDVKSGFALVSTLPSPQRYALAITNEGTLRFVDFRKKSLAHEYKTISGNSVGIARSICTATDGQWVAIGFSTGVISILDVRTGVILSLRQAHEADIATMTPISENRFLTSATDQTIAVWDAGKAAPIMIYRSFQEPVHIVQTFHNEIISASVANRVNVHRLPSESENIENDAKLLYDKPRAVSKLRSDSFRGVLTSFSVLPMKRQLLIASDNGNIKLMA